jgi:hypothetical protein
MINGIKVFDTVLSHRNLNDTTSRNASDYWKPFAQAADWSFSFERLHSLADFDFFINRKIKENVVIFSGHGHQNDGFGFSNGELLNLASLEKLKFPEKNKGKTIIFSSCLIAKNIELCRELKDFFSANSLFAYRHTIKDQYAFLFESLLLSEMEMVYLKTQKFTENNFIDYQVKTDHIKNYNQGFVKNHPMLMFK